MAAVRPAPRPSRLGVAAAAAALTVLLAACGGPAGTPRPTPPPAGSVDADRQHYGQNANRLAACDSVLQVRRARGFAAQEKAAFEAHKDIATFPAAVENSQTAAREAWGPLGYPDDRVGDAIDAADAAVTAYEQALGRYEGGVAASASVTPAGAALATAFDALDATLTELGLSCG